MHFRQTATTLFLTLLLCAAAPAETRMDVEAGWGGHIRTGRWIPVYVTVSDSKTRNVILDINWPDGGAYTMRIQQAITVDPIPRTFPLLVPARGWDYQQATFSLADASTGKTLARFPSDSNAGYVFANPYADGNASLVGVSGSISQLSTLSQATGVTTGFLDPRRLPESAIGYDSLTLLVLNEPNLIHSDIGPSELNDAQQHAIVDWVRAGGNLILWPGDAGFPSSGPLVDVLPARLQDRVNLKLSAEDLSDIGIPPRFAKLMAYHLEPKADAERISLLHGQADAYASRLGLGRIVLAPMNVGELQTSDVARSRKLWSPLVKGILPLANDVGNSPNYSYNQDTQDDVASSRIADFLGNIPGAGQIGFSYIAIVLIGMMIIVGPVDWFVLKRLGRQPWTWITTGGWIALVTLGALYAGYLFKSGDLDYKTIQTFDQVDGATVAGTNFVSLYSSRTQTYDIRTPGDGWWQSASISGSGSSGMKLDMDFHQTSDQNTPEEMVVNVWSLRFLRGDTIAPGPPLLSAKLQYVPRSNASEVQGTITNLTDRPLKNLRITTRKGSSELHLAPVPPAPGVAPSTLAAKLKEIPPHATVRVTAFAASPQTAPAEVDYGQYRYGYYADPPQESEIWKYAADLNFRRGKQMESLVQSGRFATIFAEIDQPAPAVTLAKQKALERRWAFVRALVEVH